MIDGKWRTCETLIDTVTNYLQNCSSFSLQTHDFQIKVSFSIDIQLLHCFLWSFDVFGFYTDISTLISNLIFIRYLMDNELIDLSAEIFQDLVDLRIL